MGCNGISFGYIRGECHAHNRHHLWRCRQAHSALRSQSEFVCADCERRDRCGLSSSRTASLGQNRLNAAIGNGGGAPRRCAWWAGDSCLYAMPVLPNFSFRTNGYANSNLSCAAPRAIVNKAQNLWMRMSFGLALAVERHHAFKGGRIPGWPLAADRSHDGAMTWAEFSSYVSKRDPKARDGKHHRRASRCASALSATLRLTGEGCVLVDGFLFTRRNAPRKRRRIYQSDRRRPARRLPARH